MSHYAGVSGRLHDGTAGLHLFTDECPTGCYELAIPTTGTTQQKQDQVDAQLDADKVTATVDVAAGTASFGDS